jgi:phosphohistidine phosphatase
MKRIYLLRHFKSSREHPSGDFDRPLAPRGRRAGAAISAWLAENDVAPELVLASAATRAKETLALILPALGESRIEIERGLYLASVEALLQRLQRAPDDVASIMIVAHNPGLGELAARWGDESDAFPTGALSGFSMRIASWREIGRAKGELICRARPRELD